MMSSFRGHFNKYLEDVKRILNRLQNVNLCINAKKSNFRKTKMNYLGYTVKRKGMRTQQKNIDAMLTIAQSKACKRSIQLFKYGTVLS